MATVNEIISGIESKMEKSVASLSVDLSRLRDGRATHSLLCGGSWQACVLGVQLPLCWRRVWLITMVPRHL